MTTEHLSEMELQQYVLDRATCTKEALQHMEACERCKAEAAIYQMVISGIKEHPKASFDFDLSGLVLSRLPGGAPLYAEAPHAAGDQPVLPIENSDGWRFGFSSWIMIALAGCTIGFSFYLFRKNIWNTFTGISGLFMYLILGAAAIVVALRVVAMYKKYQRQMNRLNLY